MSAKRAFTNALYMQIMDNMHELVMTGRTNPWDQAMLLRCHKQALDTACTKNGHRLPTYVGQREADTLIQTFCARHGIRFNLLPREWPEDAKGYIRNRMAQETA